MTSNIDKKEGDFMYNFDLTQLKHKVEPSKFNWYAKSKSGDEISFTNFSMLKNGKPFILVCGEMQPTRTDNRFWEESILKMKSGGLNAVSFYTHWLHIEKRPGEFDFTGNNDLRKFILLCKKHGMYAVPRIGPFFNSEATHGGLPSWLYGQPVEERSNDERYLFYVERFYNELGKQFEGLYFKDDGPIISIQLENEYEHAPGSWNLFYWFGCDTVKKGSCGESHMIKLKELAIKAGMEVPYFTCTGWGSPIPKGEMLPTYGVYAYLGRGGPSNASTFVETRENFEYPLAFCELGGGYPTQYNWRPVLPPETVEVSLFTRVACGGNITGIYMYHGGINPQSYERFYGSSQKMNLMSYDFNAPISEYGMLRESYFRVKPIQQFLCDFSTELGTMFPVYQPKYIEPKNTEDLRYMVRTDGKSGFLFINNFQDKLTLPERKDVKITLNTKQGDMVIPKTRGMTIKSDEMLILPFEMDLNGVNLKYATTQPSFKMDNNTYIFFAHEGTNPEYAFEGEETIEGKNIKTEYIDGITYVYPTDLGLDCIFNVGDVKIITITAKQARHTYKISSNKIVITDSGLLMCDNKIKLIDFNNDLSAVVFDSNNKKIDTYKHECEKISITPQIEKISDDKIVIHLTEEQFQNLNDVYLKLNYTGDLARIFHDGLLVGDNLNNGTDWLISLKRYKEFVTGKGLFIRLSPRNPEVEEDFDGITFLLKKKEEGDQDVGFNTVDLLAEYAHEFCV